MCGITGIRDFEGRPVALADLRAMCDAMVHRGPDDDGYYIGSGVGLGMRRLAIIDLAGGHQPIANEDRSVWAVLNGEIYNYRQLREELEQRGHTFATSSDTEVIVRASTTRRNAAYSKLARRGLDIRPSRSPPRHCPWARRERTG
jgi:asparagine synthase (glutamine-hydrolysing)